MLHPFTKFKLAQKELAQQIQAAKAIRKPKDRNGHEFSQAALAWDRTEYRHRHIAYCEARGRTREQIERPGKNNKPDEGKVSKYKSLLLTEVSKHEEQRAAELAAGGEALRHSA